MKKPVIVWIDHDKSVEKLIHSIAEKRRVVGATSSLGEDFHFVTRIFQPSRELHTKVLQKLREEFGDELVLTLVDYHFGEHSKADAKQEGIRLAAFLRDQRHPKPVGLYSRYGLYARERATISTERLALVLENLNQFLDKLKNPSSDLMPDDLFALFHDVFRKAETAGAESRHPLTGSFVTRVAVWEDDQPTSGTSSFRIAAPKLAEEALAKLGTVRKIALTQLSGGFSGSYLVMATLPDRDKRFVVKIDEDPARLIKELRGYDKVGGRVAPDYWLPPFSDVKKLYDNYWGAFAMHHESKATPLIDHASLGARKLAGVYSRLWSECLDKLYGQVSEVQKSHRELLPIELIESSLKAFSHLDRYAARIKALESKCQKPLKTALEFLKDQDNESFRPDKVISLPWVENVHGDLNCRNVFYDDERGTIKLIDFPNVEPGSLATDYVKAEAELCLIMMDWSTGRDCEFSLINHWSLLTGAFGKAFLPKYEKKGNPEITRMIPALRAIRSAYAASAKGKANAGEAYRLCLISRLLRYLSYSDITPAKRFLALIWVGQLLENAKQWGAVS